MALDDLMGLLGNWFGGGGSTAPSTSTLTPDQQAMQQQQGWYPRPDMVLPTGQANTQPTGYSGLTPAQATTVNNLGYYTQPGAQDQGQSLLQKATNALSDPQLQNALKGLGQNPLLNKPAGQPINPLLAGAGGAFAHFPGYGPYTIYRRSSLNPTQALANIKAGS